MRALNRRSIERHISESVQFHLPKVCGESICHRVASLARLLTMGWKSKAREKGAMETSKGIPPPSRSSSSPKPLQCCRSLLLPLVGSKFGCSHGSCWKPSTERAQSPAATPGPPIYVAVKARSTWQYKHAVYHGLEVPCTSSVSKSPTLPARRAQIITQETSMQCDG